jgi:hypothetical protein
VVEEKFRQMRKKEERKQRYLLKVT